MNVSSHMCSSQQRSSSNPRSFSMSPSHAAGPNAAGWGQSHPGPCLTVMFNLRLHCWFGRVNMLFRLPLHSGPAEGTGRSEECRDRQPLRPPRACEITEDASRRRPRRRRPSAARKSAHSPSHPLTLVPGRRCRLLAIPPTPATTPAWIAVFNHEDKLASRSSTTPASFAPNSSDIPPHFPDFATRATQRFLLDSACCFASSCIRARPLPVWVCQASDRLRGEAVAVSTIMLTCGRARNDVGVGRGARTRAIVV